MKPPGDPRQRLLWARQVLRLWSEDKSKQAVLKLARQVLDEFRRNPSPPGPSRRPGKPRRPPARSRAGSPRAR